MLEYGIFNSFWDGHPNHLPLLNLYESDNDPEVWNLKNSINQLDQIVLKSSEESIVEGVKLLLKSDDWRPHLVASLVILKLGSLKSHNLIDMLWERLKYGSWISPQILVVLSIIDKEFVVKAKNILTNGFRVTYSKMSPAEHHSARGPGGFNVAEKKIIAAAQYLVNGLVNDTDENDSGGSIAMNWKNQLVHLIKEGRFIIETKKI